MLIVFILRFTSRISSTKPVITRTLQYLEEFSIRNVLIAMDAQLLFYDLL